MLGIEQSKFFISLLLHVKKIDVRLTILLFLKVLDFKIINLYNMYYYSNNLVEDILPQKKAKLYFVRKINF